MSRIDALILKPVGATLENVGHEIDAAGIARCLGGTFGVFADRIFQIVGHRWDSNASAEMCSLSGDLPGRLAE
jgi:hypothetical protein